MTETKATLADEPNIAPLEGSTWKRLGELISLFFVIGATGFGGPAVLIAMMEDAVVRRRRWISRQYFLDLVGATNLIPGPNAVEMAIHIGFVRAGIPGLLVAGISFVVPAITITIIVAWAYVRFGTLPSVTPFLYGVKPVIVAVILSAVWRLGKPAVKTWKLVVIGAVVLAATLLDVNEIVAMFAGGILGMVWLRLSEKPQAAPPKDNKPTRTFPAFAWLGMGRVGLVGLAGTAAAAATVVPLSLWRLGLFFLRIGAVLYGSGYVLIAFIQRGLVDDLRWLTQQQLLDAVAAGQITPGPFTSTAAFVGYFLLGVPGAIVSAVGIFLPSFLLAWILNPFIPKLRKSLWTAAFLDSINVASVALMLAVSIELAFSTLIIWPLGAESWLRWPAWILAVAATIVALRWKVSPTWIVIGGALIGWVLGRFTGYI
ncbi:MAG: chromate efflux transporter [Anaerolineae bacterium]